MLTIQAIIPLTLSIRVYPNHPGSKNHGPLCPYPAPQCISFTELLRYMKTKESTFGQVYRSLSIDNLLSSFLEVLCFRRYFLLHWYTFLITVQCCSIYWQILTNSFHIKVFQILCTSSHVRSVLHPPMNVIPRRCQDRQHQCTDRNTPVLTPVNPVLRILLEEEHHCTNWNVLTNLNPYNSYSSN